MTFARLPLVSRSFVGAMLAAFAVVILPLVIALAIAFSQANALALQAQASVTRAAAYGEQSRALDDALLAMERTVRQGDVLGATEVIEGYVHQRERLIRAAAQLGAQVGVAGAQVDAVITQEALVHSTLQSDGAAAALARWPGLAQAANALIESAANVVTNDRAAMLQRPTQVAHSVLGFALLALPVALMLAAVLAWRLGRPIRSLARAIHRLGDGDLNLAIEVGGPSDIAQLGVQLEWLREKLIELQTAQRTLLQSVSHDLKTPLAAITEGRALLAEGLAGTVSREQRAVLDLIALNAERLLARINALVEAGARMQARGVATRVAMAEVVEDVLAEHAFVCATRKLRVQAELENADVHGDREQLRMIVDNLVSNAIKYSPDAAAIRIDTHCVGERLVLRVIDEGPGVAPDEVERIFAPNARGSAADVMNAPGSGMGLALAQSLAQANGGVLRLAASAGLRGATFVLELPLMPEAAYA